MSYLNKIKNYAIDSYLKENRTKIDESLVSLRLMKEVDDFLNEKKISQREFADNVGYSEAFVSQLMSGTKKINTSFINRFEKAYDLRIDFRLKSKELKNNLSSQDLNAYVEVNINIYHSSSADSFYPIEIKTGDIFESTQQILNLEA